ncbi:unnamed protein product [Allacma fusca]|uniref:Uncharacterized protein n=1 Tax=Allacma fusca TaxID=39272 RepID=A0A8J2KQ64_9HEXA|nr:unnamed protein product [Allacma fusca]
MFEKQTINHILLATDWRRHRQRTQPSVALNLENPNYQGAEDNIYDRFPGFVEMEPMETNITLTPEGSPRRLPSPPGSISFSVYSTILTCSRHPQLFFIYNLYILMSTE